MATKWRRVGIGVAVVAACAFAYVGGELLSSRAAYRRLGDVEWRETATPDDLRRTAEASLGWWFGNPHEAFIVLTHVGDESSVPHVEGALWRRPSGEKVSCTWGHADEALERIRADATGE